MGRSNEEAVQALLDTWVINNNNCKEAWRLQKKAEAAQRADQQRLLDEQAVQERQQREEEVEQERVQAEKKKPKINDFDESRAIDDTITPNPSPYAINKLTNFNYIELYYFTKVDRELSWSQFGVAKNKYLHQIAKLKWPLKHIEALTTFSFNLKIHDYHNKSRDDEALLSYTCHSR